MFEFTKKILIRLLSSSGFFATKCMSLNNEQCRTRSTLIGLNTV